MARLIVILMVLLSACTNNELIISDLYQRAHDGEIEVEESTLELESISYIIHTACYNGHLWRIYVPIITEETSKGVFAHGRRIRSCNRKGGDK